MCLASTSVRLIITVAESIGAIGISSQEQYSHHQQEDKEIKICL